MFTQSSASKNAATAVTRKRIQFFMGLFEGGFLVFHGLLQPGGNHGKVLGRIFSDRFDLGTDRRKATDSSMRHVPVTFPAGAICAACNVIRHKSLRLGI